MLTPPHILVSLGILLFFASGVCAGFEPEPAPTVTLHQAVHFIAPNGTATVVQEGTYRVEGVEGALRLISGEGDSGHLVQTQPMAHEETLTAPVALVIAIDEDIVHVVFLLPGGEGQDAVGSSTGVKSRAPSTPTLSLSQIKQGLASASSGTTLQKSGTSGQQPGQQAFSSTLPSALGEARMAGAPATPVLITPPPNTTVSLIAPGNTTLAFTWKPGPGGPTPTSYKLCVTEENKSCGQPGAWIFPFPGQPPITKTTYAARLPGNFQGKRLRWSVSAWLRANYSWAPAANCVPPP